MRGRALRHGLIALALAAGIVVPAGNAVAAVSHEPLAGAGGIGVRLVGPAGSYIVEQLAPGTLVRRRIEIVNSTGSTELVAVYPAAARLQDGVFGFAPGHSQNELTDWTSVSRDPLLLSPSASAFETVTINVPRDATSGRRYAVVWAEISVPAADGIARVNRVGIRVYLTVGPPANFAIGPLAAGRSATGKPLVVTTIRNTGQRPLDISGTLSLGEGPGSLRAGPYPVKLDSTLAAGNSDRLTIPLDTQLPHGPWRAHLALSSGQLQRTAEATLTFPLYTVPQDQSPRLMLIVILSSILLAVAAFALLHFWLKHRGRRDFRPVAHT